MRQFKTLKWICRPCGWTWEVITVIIDGETPRERCLSCESYNTTTIVQAPSIKFNSTGFHDIDYS